MLYKKERKYEQRAYVLLFSNIDQCFCKQYTRISNNVSNANVWNEIKFI